MRSTHLRQTLAAILATLLVGVALSASGCSSPAPVKKKLATIPVTTATVDATAAAADAAASAAAGTAGISSGPISTPGSNSPVTAKLAVAARAYLKTSSKFTINQLYQQGDVAVGDITPKSGGARIFIAWTGPTWKTVWTAPMGQGSATIARATVPQMSKELATKMNWAPKIAAAGSAAVAAPDTSGLQTSFTAYVKSTMTNYVGGADVAGTVTVTDVRVVPDNKGVYWGSALAEASSGGDSVSFYAKYVGGKWVGQGNSDQGVTPADSKFPAEVQGLL